MKYFNLFLIALLTIAAGCFAQDTILLKRVPYKLTVPVDKNSSYEEQIKATAYVLPDKSVQLYPGETVYIEVEQENGIIKSVRAVKENKNPSITVIISFTQMVNNKVNKLSMLKITNPFQNQLVYKARIFLLQQKRWIDTNVYPVGAELSGYETWPNIITSIWLGNWTFQSK